MLKNILKSTIISLGMLMFAVSAYAASAPIEINLNGATAQYKYWVDAARAYLTNRGCASGNLYYAQDGTNGIAVCIGKNAFGNLAAVADGGITVVSGSTNDTVVIRYTGTASDDGVNSVQGLGSRTQGSVTCSGNLRPMADGTDITLANWGTHTVGNKACKPVIIGASDVNATTFAQESHGYKDGPALTNGWQDLYANNLTINLNAYNDDQPLIVPFAFFASSDAPVDNLTRLQAVQLFGGQINNWNKFGYAAGRVTICLRHAGSGTHATLDAAVMRGDYSLAINQNPNQAGTDTTSKPRTWFNGSSGTMMSCINGQAKSIGYADADQATAIGSGKTYTNVKSVTYMGAAATQANIYNGIYDFWSAQNLYSSKSAPADTQTVIADLVSFASDVANLPTSVSAYWVTAGQMKVTKDTDFTLPHR